MIRNNVSAIIGQRRMTIAETAKLAGLHIIPYTICTMIKLLVLISIP